MPDRVRRHRLKTIRVRTTIAAVVVVALALGVAGFVIVAAQRRALTHRIETVARLRGQDIEAAIAGGRRPSEIPMPIDDEAFVQLVDSDGEVEAGTEEGLDRRALHIRIPRGEEYTLLTFEDSGTQHSPFRLFVGFERADDGEGVSVYSGQSLNPVEGQTRSLVELIGLSFAALVALVGAITWLVVGRTLAPVENIRREVESIRGRELHRRVPETGTGDEVDRLAATMNSMLARVEEAADRQRRFVADASHELRSPLTGLRAELEVRIAHPGADVGDADGDVLEEVKRMQRLVDDLLALAQSDTADGAGRRETVDLDDLVLAEVRRLRTRGGVTVDASNVTGAQTLGDADALRRVVRNLLDNAERYAASTVRVLVHDGDGAVTFVVADDGAGIPPEMRERVFERFTRTDEARGRGMGGAGLGLAIAREIVEAHGGTIRLVDGAGGAMFEVILPSS